MRSFKEQTATTANEFLRAAIDSVFSAVELIDDAVRADGPLSTRAAYKLSEELGEVDRHLQKLARRVQRGHDDEPSPAPAPPDPPPNPPPRRKPSRPRMPERWPMLAPGLNGELDDE